jgi:hypothetical protein
VKGRYVHRRWTLLSPLAVVIGTLSACGSAPVVGPTPSQAQNTAITFVLTKNKLPQEGGTLRQLDAATQRVKPIATEPPAAGASPSAGAQSAPTTHIDGIKAYVPHQTEYPMEFLATVDTTVPDIGTFHGVLFFTKQTADARWLAVDFVILPPTTPPPVFATDAEGYAEKIAPESFGSYATNIGLVPVTYVHDLTPGAVVIDDSFAPGPLPQGARDVISGVAGLLGRAGVAVDFNATPVNGSLAAYKTKDGSAFALFDYAGEYTMAGKNSGDTFSWGPNEPQQRSGLLAGRYKNLTVHLGGSTAVIDPAGSGGKLQAIGDYGDIIAADGAGSL